MTRILNDRNRSRRGRRVPMRILTIAVLVSLAGTVVAAVPQAKTDFSGRWTTESDPAAPVATQGGAAAAGQPGARGGGGGGRGPARGDMGSGWGPTITVTQDARQLVIEYSVFARGDMQPPLKFLYALDGSETKNTVMMGRGMQAQTSRTAWDGTRLKITTTQTLTLESPTQLVVDTVRAGVLGAPDTTTKTVYRKL